MQVKPHELINSLEKILTRHISKKRPQRFNEYGLVLSIQDGIVIASGLRHVGLTELVLFPNGIKGLVSTLERNIVKICLMGSETLIKPGMTIHRAQKFIEVPVGKELLGRVVDSLGRPIDGKGTLTNNRKLENFRVERPAPGIMDRRSVHEPLHTGTKAIDALIPIGRGQRELILGDRNTGKTTLAIDTIINQTNHNKENPHDKIYSVYVAVGQRQSKVQDVLTTLQKFNSLESTCVVFAPSYAPAILQFIAPYSGTSIAEYFRDTGRHSVIIYDDLTKHAQIHRQLSLLLKTPPGREAYPGDVFFVHSRLLERSAKLSDAKKSGSLTALPILETFDGDATSYIPTNVISITDGQIYLRQDLFFSGIKPAINVNFSVSRVGSAAQIESMRQLCGKLKLQMALYNDYKIFARFTSDLDPTIKNILIRGDRLLEIFKQKANTPFHITHQILSLLAGLKGFLDDIPLSKVSAYERQLHHYAITNPLWSPYIMELEDDIDELAMNSLLLLFGSVIFQKN